MILNNIETCYSEERTGKYDLPDGIPYLGAFYLYMTACCNLSCRHCWITPVHRTTNIPAEDYISVDRLHSAILEAKPLGLNHIKLTGGEPTLHPEFLQTTEMIANEGISSDMESNGTLITSELARHLVKNTSVNFVSVSLDSHILEMHYSFRGVKGRFQESVAGIINLVEVGYLPQIIICVH